MLEVPGIVGVDMPAGVVTAVDAVFGTTVPVVSFMFRFDSRAEREAIAPLRMVAGVISTADGVVVICVAFVLSGDVVDADGDFGFCGLERIVTFLFSVCVLGL